MPRYRTRVCATCGKEKPTYLFDRKDEDCVVCAGKNVLKRVGKGVNRDPDVRPKPGSFWRALTERATRIQIVKMFEKDGEEYVRYLALEGMHEGKERTIKYVGFRVNYAPEDETNRHKHGWEPWKHTNWWKENKKKKFQ